MYIHTYVCRCICMYYCTQIHIQKSDTCTQMSRFLYYMLLHSIFDQILENQSNCHHYAYSILLAQLITTLIHYRFTVPLPGLTDWSVFQSKFSDHVNSQLRQQDPWRVLHARHGSEINSSGSETSLDPMSMFGPMAGTSWTHSQSKQS